MLCCVLGHGQIKLNADAVVNTEEHSISIRQTVSYTNTSRDTLRDFYFNDWANAFKSKVSPLGKRFSQDYIKRFHYSSLSERGYTELDFIKNKFGENLYWQRPEGHPDVLKLTLNQPLAPGGTVNFQLKYTVKIPEDKFTGYGRNNDNYKLRYWLIAPATYRNSWQIYSHENLNDQFQPKTDVSIVLKLPAEYKVVSALQSRDLQKNRNYKRIELTGKNQTNFKLQLLKYDYFQSFQTDFGSVVSNITDDGVKDDLKALTVDRIMKFLKRRLGDYPHKKLMVTQEDYDDNPVYGLNQLPSFIRPFPEGFQYDIKMLKTIAHNYLANTMLINPRKEKWIQGAIQTDLMMDYVNDYYTDTKLIGTLSKVIGIRWSHLADLDFNDRYRYLFMNMNRLNIDQALAEPQDSLLKFNKQIANPYKGGVGFKYLEDFLGDDAVKTSIKEFYQDYKLKDVSPKDFEGILKANAKKDVDWFFDQYVNTNVRLDFKIKHLEKTSDSLRVTIKNKEDNSMPVSLYGLNDKKIVSKYWVENTAGLTTVTIPRKNIKRLGLNYEGVIPEVNQRNNYKSVTTLLNKPLQFRLLQDVEDPRYDQFFLIPEFDYNLYDGFSVGPKIFNSNLLFENFSYSISPKYGFTSRDLVGSAAFFNTHQFRNKSLNAIRYGFTGTRYSYAKNLFYYRYSPYIRFGFRDKNLRSNKSHFINLRNVNVHREQNQDTIGSEDPNYNVFNLRYSYNNQNFVNYFTASLDYQIAKKFSKVSVTAKYRKLFLDNRKIEFRLFAGAFLYNHTDPGSNYFSFALDRPTDYLFDYDYYGRSESSGMFSQQFIEAEGGFKSKLEPAFANRWLTTINANASIWNWIYAYGDVGMIKNYGESPKIRYDSGIRVSLVQDYFELFFPVYSNLGWEIAQPDYDQKIRFIVSLSFNTLISLFEREYY